MSKLKFSTDIQPLFRTFDVNSMRPCGIDLSSYEEVKKRARDIYHRVSTKEMPCDEGWSDANIQKFKEWMEGGMKE